MIRKAGTEDAGAIAAFLEGHLASSMFLLGNLEAHGVGNTTHPYGTSFFLRETGDGINGVFGCTNGGYLMCQLPGLTATEAQTYAHLLKGYTLRGMTGDAAQVATILGALPVAEEAWTINRVEPLYNLDLAQLRPSEAELRLPEEDDLPLLVEWFGAYMVDTGMYAAPKPEEAEANAKAALSSGRNWLMIEEGRPVAMTGINARSGPAVQVGMVFVPHELRGQGRAGRAVLAQLAALRPVGITRAVLFAASAGAGRVYERNGFERAGDYRVALLAEPVLLGNPA